METKNSWITGTLMVAVIVGIVTCLWRITQSAPTPNEALLLSLFLTLLSIIASWIVSRYYSESSYNKSLRIFALKAAEKVTNLSNELDRLTVFIQEELKDDEYDSQAEALLAKNLRFEGAIHIINTLKSVNDRSLSDWQGVIGEEISAQRQVQEEREETLRDLLDRLDSLQRATLDSTKSQHDEERQTLFSEVASIRSELRFLASRMSGVPVIPMRAPKKRDVQKPCPNCGHVLQYRQKSKAKSVIGMQCSKCGARLCSREADGDFLLGPRTPIDDIVTCPSCAQRLEVKTDPVPGSVVDVDCPHCDAVLRVSRGQTELRIRLREPAKAEAVPTPLGEEFLKKVAGLMGARSGYPRN